MIYYAWTWSNILGDFGGDSAYYLLIAEYFSPYSPHFAVAEYFAHHNPYPPLYPFALALLGGANSFLTAHFITTTFLLLAFVSLFTWLKSEGFSPLASLLYCAIFAVLPGTYMQALSVHSESLFLLLSLAAIAIVAMEERRDSARMLWIAALCVAAAVLSRTAGVSLAAAFLIYIWLKNVKDRLWLALLVTGPFVIWQIFGPTTEKSYVASFIKKYQSDWIGTLLAQLSTEASALWYGWNANFTTTHGWGVLLGVIGLICIAGMFARVRAGKLDGFYVLLYLILILVWPFPAEAQRFVFAILPVVLAQGILLLQGIQNKINRKRKISVFPAVLMSLIGLLAMPDLMLTVQRFMDHLPDYLSNYRHDPGWYSANKQEAIRQLQINNAIVKGISSIKQSAPGSTCVYSIKPSIVALYSDRISIAPPHEDLDDQSFNSELKRSGCRYFYLLPFSSPTYHSPFYPLERIRPKITGVEISRLHDDSNAPIMGILARIKL